MKETNQSIMQKHTAEFRDKIGRADFKKPDKNYTITYLLYKIDKKLNVK